VPTITQTKEQTPHLFTTPTTGQKLSIIDHVPFISANELFITLPFIPILSARAAYDQQDAAYRQHPNPYALCYRVLGDYVLPQAAAHPAARPNPKPGGCSDMPKLRRNAPLPQHRVLHVPVLEGCKRLRCSKHCAYLVFTGVSHFPNVQGLGQDGEAATCRKRLQVGVRYRGWSEGEFQGPLHYLSMSTFRWTVRVAEDLDS
jgi:hypothetical protein